MSISSASSARRSISKGSDEKVVMRLLLGAAVFIIVAGVTRFLGFAGVAKIIAQIAILLFLGIPAKTISSDWGLSKRQDKVLIALGVMAIGIAGLITYWLWFSSGSVS